MASGEDCTDSRLRSKVRNMSRLSQQYLSARRHSDYVVLEGFHPIKHAWRKGLEVTELYTHLPEQIIRTSTRLSPDLTARFARAQTLSRAEFQTLSPHYVKTGIIGLARKPAYTLEQILAGDGYAVYLDEVRNLNNLGAIVRTLAARGVAGLLYSGTLDVWHPKCVSIARGLQLALPVVPVEQLPETPGREIIGFDERGELLRPGTLPENAILAFGSERTGLAPATRARLSRTVRIPMQPGISSLNLATAVAIGVYS